MQGYLDEVSRDLIRGWAWEPGEPDRALELELLVDGQTVTRVIANAMRSDLHAAGIGDGRHSFSIDLRTLALPITPLVVRMKTAGSGEELQNSPAKLEPPLELNGAAGHAIAALLQSPGTEEALRQRLQFLAAQADQLLQLLADKQSNRFERAQARSRKWRWRPEDGPEPPRLAPRALIVDSVLPSPSRDAGSNAVISHAQSLQRLGFEVSLAPADMRDGEGAPELMRLGIPVLGPPWRGSVEEVMRRDGEFDLVYLHRIDVAHRYGPIARHCLPRARIVYNVADLHHLRLQRQSEVEDRPEMAPGIAAIRAQELLAAAAAHAVIVHSDAEAALLRRLVPRANVFVVPWSVRTGRGAAGFAERSGLAFVGHYSHAPNLDAATWLVHDIMPLVWREAPEVRCFLAGSGLPAALKQPKDPRIVPLGRIGALSEVLDHVRLTVAPLNFGAGLKGKVLDSLAAGVPCACTPIAAEGFALPDCLGELVSADAEGVARATLALHGDPELFERCSAAGMLYMRQAFSDRTVDEALRRAVGMPTMAAGERLMADR